MKTFREYFEDEQKLNKVVLWGGGFKPPHKGHYEAFKNLLGEAGSGIVYIGKRERDGITAEQSKAIWDIYKDYLGKPVNVHIAELSPIKSVYDFADDNKDIGIIAARGAKEDKTGGKDIDAYKSLGDSEKYPNVEVREVAMEGEGIGGTESREAMSHNIDDAIDYLVPGEIKQTDRDTIKAILVNK
tara:strand:- start:40 stop:597 length:558 start_codon:yes stop_codon:yes gene_type:complete